MDTELFVNLKKKKTKTNAANQNKHAYILVDATAAAVANNFLLNRIY